MKTIRGEMNLEKAIVDDLKDFSPLDIDITEFKDLKDCLPRDTQIDGTMASNLANQFLRAADRCSEIVSELIWRFQKAKQDAKTAKSLAYLRAKDSDKRITDNMAKNLSEVDEEYLTTSQKCIDIEAVLERFKMKHSLYLKAFHLMKDKIKSENQHMLASGFSETNGEGSWND